MKARQKPSWYQGRIAELLKCSLADARLVEGYMRLESGTLDALSPTAFYAEAAVCFEAVEADREEAELLARSYGL